MRAHQSKLNTYADELLERLSREDRTVHADSPDRTDNPDNPDSPDHADHADDVGRLLTRATVGGRPMPKKDQRMHVLGLLLAGNETTAAALSWAVVNAARHPDEWARLRIDPSAVRPFLDETLRLTPAVWGFARRPKVRGVTLDGHRIGRNEVVTVYLRGMNRDPTRWIEPLQFRPDRHRTGSPLDATMLSFGLGPRGCIGQHLAMAEMLAVLPVLAAGGDFSLDLSRGDLVEDASFALRVRGGLRATLR